MVISNEPRRRPAQAPATITAVETPRKRASVFDRITPAEAPAAKRTVSGQRVALVPVNPTTLPAMPFVPGRHDAEASSSGKKPSRRQVRRYNAELRTQQLQPDQPAMPQTLKSVVAVPTKNKFENLKWVKRNSPTSELKESFWAEPEHQAPKPQKKKQILV